MGENFPNLVRDMDIHAHKSHRTPNRFNTKRTSSRHIEIKPLKIKDKEFETSKRKKKSHCIKGIPHKSISSFLNKNFAGAERVG